MSTEVMRLITDIRVLGDIYATSHDHRTSFRSDFDAAMHPQAISMQHQVTQRKIASQSDNHASDFTEAVVCFSFPS